MTPIRFIVLTASDSGSRGERQDRSGELIVERLRRGSALLVEKRILPDDRRQLASYLQACCDAERADLILTTGGTGFTARDLTPEATADVIERPVPGIPEALRARGLEKTPRAILSRGIAGIRRRTLIINLPGSPKAVAEGLDLLEEILPHAVATLRSSSGLNCAESEPPS
jgi:molybdenum cofactor synthesis domain-containing protein